MNWKPRGNKLDFVKHKYLEQIYKDYEGRGDGEIYYQKSAQVGLTEKLVSEALWLVDQYNYNSIYFFPTTSTMADLVRERIDQPLRYSNYLASVASGAKLVMGKHADNIGLKRMSLGFCYFRGSNALAAITSVPGDAIFVDEVDRMNGESVPYFEKRLEHSNLRWQRWASTPTVSGFGINRLFVNSDQMHWMVKCNHCGQYQELDFFVNVDIDRKIILCRHCKKQIIPWQLDGEWVAKFPDKPKRGYQICSLYSPMVNVAKLVEASQKVSEYEIQQFYNQNLGIPYEPRGGKINDDDLERCKKDYVSPYLS